MKKFFLDYILKLSLLTIILGIIGFILFKTILSDYYLPVFWLLILFFFIINVFSQSVIYFSQKKPLSKFGSAYVLSYLVKFISYLIFLVIYMIISERITITFAIVFFLLYLIYTLFDVRRKIVFSKTYSDKIEKSD
ncbi:MAG: hypothetical protein JW723_15930 [Bacteroidales bacterium]|nr:hypothetical protein [Bacteroidales bacterium]